MDYRYIETRSAFAALPLYSLYHIKETVLIAKGKYQKWLVPDGLKLLEAWARDGLTDEQIAHNMGVSIRTLYGYKGKHVQILQALKKGKEVVDVEVENALYKRALGYSYTETTRERVYDPETEIYGLVVTKTVVKEVQPDVTAQIFWLKNRKPDVWRDRQEQVHSGAVPVTIIDDVGAEVQNSADG